MTAPTASRFSRSVCDGTAKHDDVGAGERLLGVVGRRDRRRQLDARQVVGVLAALVDRSRTTSSRRAHSVTSLPASASTSENAVPHDPAPNTATLRHRALRPRPLPSCSLRVADLAYARPCAGRTARPGPSRRGARSTRSVIAAMIRSVASLTHLGRARLARQVVEVDRVADLHRDLLAREQVRASSRTARAAPARPTARPGSPGSRCRARSARRRTCRPSATGRGRG